MQRISNKFQKNDLIWDEENMPAHKKNLMDKHQRNFSKAVVNINMAKK